MKKLAIETKIAIILSAIVIGIASLIGIILAFGIGGELFGGVIEGFNGPDINRVGSLFGLLAVPVVIVVFLIYIIFFAGIFIAVIWLVWGIVKLIKKAINKKNTTMSEDLLNKNQPNN